MSVDYNTSSRAQVAIDDLKNNPWRAYKTPGDTDESRDAEQIDYWLSWSTGTWFTVDGSLGEFIAYVHDNYPAYVLPEDHKVFVHDVSIDNDGLGTIELDEEDVVNHPSHYKTANGLEAIDVLEAFDLKRDGRLFNAGKYILRAGKKDAELQDLKKAVWYLNRYIAEAESNG